MIQSFADATTEDIYHGKYTKAARKIDKALWPVIQRKLDLLDKAKDLRDVTSVPGNRAHPLKGDKKGRIAIRVNDQYRIAFRPAKSESKALFGGKLVSSPDLEAHEVCCEDYH